MASVEVSKLSNQELAELSCTYAALILHDDDQAISGTTLIIQPINSANSFKLQVSRSKPTGLKYSQRLSKVKTSVHFSTSEDQLLQVLLSQLQLKKTNQRRKRKSKLLLHLLQKKKRKTWIWETSSDDCLLPSKLLHF